MGFTPCKAEQPLQGMELQEKKHKKDCRKGKEIKGKHSIYRQRIPEFSDAWKETVEINIHVTSRNGDKKMMQSIRIMNRPP